MLTCQYHPVPVRQLEKNTDIYPHVVVDSELTQLLPCNLQGTSKTSHLVALNYTLRFRLGFLD